MYINVMYYALRVGFLDDDVIGCMIVPFNTLSLLKKYYLLFD
jgi:hypothetical protein